LRRVATISLASLIVGFASTCLAQEAADYFPLEAGNTWRYLRRWRRCNPYTNEYVESVDHVTVTTTGTRQLVLHQLN
jgi:hypothetical protein